jgi:hypothetical protein
MSLELFRCSESISRALLSILLLLGLESYVHCRRSRLLVFAHFVFLYGRTIVPNEKLRNVSDTRAVSGARLSVSSPDG